MGTDYYRNNAGTWLNSLKGSEPSSSDWLGSEQAYLIIKHKDSYEVITT